MISPIRTGLAPALSLVIFLALSLSVVSAVGSTFQRDDATRDELADIDFFMTFFLEDQFDCSYLLEEINIVGYQQEEFRQFATDAVNEWLALSVKTAKLRDASASMESLKQEALAFQKKLVTQIQDILLPSQLADLRRVLTQRDIICSLNCEPFEIIVKGRIDLEMTERDAAEYKKASSRLTEGFELSKKELIEKAWKKIRPAMPEGTKQDLGEVLALLQEESKSQLKAEPVDFQELEKWTEDDFDNYETQSLQNLIYGTWRSESLRNRLGILDSQLEEMLELNRLSTPLAEDPTEKTKIYELAAKGDKAGLKAFFKKKQKAIMESRQIVVDKIIRNVLLPRQIELMRSIAQYKRQILELKFGDEFGTALAWSKSFGGPDFNSSKLTKVVESAREEYYSELKKLRKSTCEKALAALPTEAREKFRSSYGEFYDYPSERVAIWDSARNQSKKVLQQAPSTK